MVTVVVTESSQMNGAGNPTVFPNLENYFSQATKKFENMIKNAVESFIAKLGDLESTLNASLEFERKRVDDLQSNQNTMKKKKMDVMEKEISELKSQINKHDEMAANRNERFSRRNNICVVGFPEPAEGNREDC